MPRKKSDAPTKTELQKMLNNDNIKRDYATRKQCTRCGRSLPLTNFFKNHDGERIDLCKTCLTANIDNRKPSTFLWILKDMNVPYVEPMWIDLCKLKYKRDPARFGPSSVLGTYIRSMNIALYREFDYDSSDEATAAYWRSHGGDPNERKAVMDAAREEAQARLDSGEVTDPDELAKLRAMAVDFDADKIDTHLKAGKEAQFNERAAREALNLAKDDASASRAGAAMVSHKIAQQTVQEELNRKRAEELERWKAENAKYVDANAQRCLAEQEAEFAPSASLAEAVPPVLPSLSSIGEIASLDPLIGSAAAATPSPPPPDVADAAAVAQTSVLDEAARRDAAIMDQLTEDDIRRLSIKWGESYRASEWLRMEEMYQKYANEYEISVDREQVLIQMCKVNLAMDNALEDGDVNGYAKYSSAFDQLRKSAKFTEAQNKEEKSAYLDSVGELVRAVEQDGGIIPQFDYKNKYNKDKVDLTLQDMKAYTYNLVKNEMNLGDLIESYIAKLEEYQKSQAADLDLKAGLITSSKDEDTIADEWSKNLEESISADADRIFASLKEDDDN